MKKYLKITYTNKKNIEYIETKFITKIEKIHISEYINVIKLNPLISETLKGGIRLNIFTLDGNEKNYLLTETTIEEVDEIDLKDLLNMEE